MTADLSLKSIEFKTTKRSVAKYLQCAAHWRIMCLHLFLKKQVFPMKIRLPTTLIPTERFVKLKLCTIVTTISVASDSLTKPTSSSLVIIQITGGGGSSSLDRRQRRPYRFLQSQRQVRLLHQLRLHPKSPGALSLNELAWSYFSAKKNWINTRRIYNL